jgi:hypothetical protein
MKRTFTRSFTCVAIIGLSFLMGEAIAQTEEQIERFNKEREAYFNDKLQLTDAESKAFWPLYNDFYNRKMKLIEDERNTFKYSQKNADNLSEQEIVETLEKIQRLKTEQAQLEQEYYHKKFPEVLPPKKVLKLYKVEWDFRGYLINKIRGEGEQGGHGGGGRNPRGGMEEMEPMPPPPPC